VQVPEEVVVVDQVAADLHHLGHVPDTLGQLEGGLPQLPAAPDVAVGALGDGQGLLRVDDLEGIASIPGQVQQPLFPDGRLVIVLGGAEVRIPHLHSAGVELGRQAGAGNQLEPFQCATHLRQSSPDARRPHTGELHARPGDRVDRPEGNGLLHQRGGLLERVGVKYDPSRLGQQPGRLVGVPRPRRQLPVGGDGGGEGAGTGVQIGQTPGEAASRGVVAEVASQGPRLLPPLHRLGVGVEARRPLSRPLRVLQRLGVIAGLGEVVSQDLEVVLERPGEDLFHGAADPGVEVPATGGSERVGGRLLHQILSEDVLELREAP
jgi:hypothetical protein